MEKAEGSAIELQPPSGELIERRQRKCLELVRSLLATLGNEEVFKPSHVRALRACLTICELNLRQFDDFLSSIGAQLSSSGSKSSVKTHIFAGAKELLASYDKTLESLFGLSTLLEDLRSQGRISRFFSSINLRRRFDHTSSVLTEHMKELLERHSTTMQAERAIFGKTLKELMDKQKIEHPSRKLPRIVNYLCEAILSLNGVKEEGLFRVNCDEVQMKEMKRKIELSDCKWTIKSTESPHIFAGLLKLWLRELPDPVVPMAYYDQCISVANDPQASVAIVSHFPKINRRVLYYLIDFLQSSILPAEQTTKMGLNNLATIFGANIINNPNHSALEQLAHLEAQRAFIKHLLENLGPAGKSRRTKKHTIKRRKINDAGIITPERIFWAQFPVGLQVSWDQFQGALINHLKLPSLPEYDAKLLQYVLDSSNTGFVTIHKYDELVKGFGPLSCVIPNLKFLFSRDWWHGYLTSEEATYLLEGSPPGTFLGRMSASNPGSYALAFVADDGQVKHVLVKSIASRLLPNGKGVYLPLEPGKAIAFPNLSSLVDSKHFSFLNNPFTCDFIEESFFHGMVTREDAEELLADQPIGTFLIRFSTTRENCLAIAAVADDKGKVLHSLIKRENGMYGGESEECTYHSIRTALAELFPGLTQGCPNVRTAMYEIVKNLSNIPTPSEVKSNGQEIELTTPSSAGASTTPSVSTNYIMSVVQLEEATFASPRDERLKGKEKEKMRPIKSVTADHYYIGAMDMQQLGIAGGGPKSPRRMMREHEKEEEVDLYSLYSRVEESDRQRKGSSDQSAARLKRKQTKMLDKQRAASISRASIISPLDEKKKGGSRRGNN